VHSVPRKDYDLPTMLISSSSPPVYPFEKEIVKTTESSRCEADLRFKGFVSARKSNEEF
jgi:hypothetical protein